jgi:hypothetical protein
MALACDFWRATQDVQNETMSKKKEDEENEEDIQAQTQQTTQIKSSQKAKAHKTMEKWRSYGILLFQD